MAMIHSQPHLSLQRPGGRRRRNLLQRRAAVRWGWHRQLGRPVIVVAAAARLWGCSDPSCWRRRRCLAPAQQQAASAAWERKRWDDRRARCRCQLSCLDDYDSTLQTKLTIGYIFSGLSAIYRPIGPVGSPVADSERNFH